ncbi:MAG: RNA polymerase sigma factor [Candidatus Omnitrophica bacterium]|nr:RNA polymerase sigma factor [Candidatus Omnitrophota bacterium]
MKDIDSKLIQDARKGDIRSFEEIYKLTSGFVYAVSYRVMGSKMDAEEVTQDVFIRIYDNLDKYEDGTSFKSWIYRITMNISINYYKKAKRRRSYFRDNFDVAVETYGRDSEIEGNIDKEEKDKKIKKLLGVLNTDQRACMVLRVVEGLSYEEIANVLKVKINTVRTRLKRAREKMLSHASKNGVLI